jgi:NitT/TauT family transport system substrate-binding protein
MRIVASALAVFCLGILASAQAQPTKVNLRLDWKAGGQYSPFYYAKEKGFYAAENLDVQVMQGSGSSDSLKHLATRGVDIALMDALVLVQGAEQKVPVKAVAAYYQRTPIVLISPKSKPITDVKQLLGDVKLGAPKGSAVYQGLVAMLAANNMKLEQLKMVDIGFGVQPLLVKQVDAIMAYTNVQPI